jgi:hypothetical protein
MADTYLRQNSQLIKGDELWLFIGTSEGQELPTCFATQHSLNRSLSTTSVSSKDHGNTSYVIPGEGSWTCSTEALMSMSTEDTGAKAFVDIMDAYDQGDLVYVKFGKLSNYTQAGIVDVAGATEWQLATPYWTGKGYITSLQASGGHGDSATFSIEITGIGPLAKTSTPPTPTTGYTVTIDNTPALEGIIISDHQTAEEGDIVTLSIYNDEVDYVRVVVSSSDVEITDEGGEWIFTMPDHNVTITAGLKYNVSLGGNDENFTLGNSTRSQWLLPGQTVEVHTNDTSFGSTYLMDTNDGTTFTWVGGSYNYFGADMPDYYNSSYSYMIVTPTQRQQGN